MLRQTITCAVFFSAASSSFAGVAITLIPTTPISPGGPTPGQQINIDVLAQLTPGTPSVPNAGGTTSIRVRMIQFDLADSDAALTISPVNHHLSADIGPIPFWDLGSETSCANDETVCGYKYFIDGSLAGDALFNIRYTGLTSNYPIGMLRLSQSQPRRIGELSVTLPMEQGTYFLDVLNADETDLNRGAEIRWGFDFAADPTDPTSPLRASTGGITGGQICLGNCIPEPGMLALLGLGGLAISRRIRTR